MRTIIRYLAIAFTLVSPFANASTWIEVEGHGHTLDEAKKNGFRQAIEFVVGQVVVSDVEVSGDQIIKDFIGSYSAGYVDNFEIRQTHRDGDEVTLNMNVSVASSKIAQRMRSSSNHQTILAGQKLQAQIDTTLDQRSNGDHILSDVISSYPYNAYIINSGSTEVVIGSRREIYIDIPYEIRWSHYWIESLIEVLGHISADAKSCINMPDAKEFGLSYSGMKVIQDKFCGDYPDITVTYKKPDSWMVTKNNFYFPDLISLDVIKREIRNPIGQQHIGLVVDLKDASGSVIDTRCARIPTDQLLGYTTPRNEVVNMSHYEQHLRPQINGHAGVAGTLRIHAKEINLSEVSRVDMRLEKTCS